MRKISLLGTLMLLLFGVGSLKAQDATLSVITAKGTKVTDVNTQLQEGTKVIFYNVGRSAYINCEGTKLMMRDLTLNDFANASYVWVVSKTTDGLFQFKNAFGNYIPELKDGPITAVTTKEQAGKFKIKKNDDPTAKQDEWLITGPKEALHFDGTAINGTFNGWNNKGNNSRYEIYIPTFKDVRTCTVKCVDQNNQEFDSQIIENANGKTATIYNSNFAKVTSTTGNGYSITGNTLTLTDNAPATITVKYEISLPFAVSEEPKNGAFDVNTKWQQLKINANSKNLIKCNKETGTVSAESPNADADQFIADEYYWCVTGNIKDGFKIYNRATGATKSLVHENGPKLVTTSNVDNAKWMLVNPQNDGITIEDKTFCLQAKGKDDKQCIHNGSGNNLTYWSATKGSYMFAVAPASAADLAKATLKTTKAEGESYRNHIGTGLGKFADNGLIAALDKANPNTEVECNKLTEEIKNAIKTLQLNKPETGKYYRFKGSRNHYISSKEIKIRQHEQKPSPVLTDKVEDAIFYLTKDNKLVTSNALCMSSSFVLEDLGTTVEFTTAPTFGKYIITSNGLSFSDAEKNVGDAIVDRGSSDASRFADCAWTIEEVTGAQAQKITKTINDKYATLAAPVALNIPSGVTAYTVSVEGNKANMTAINGTVIPAGTAVVLEKTGNGNSFEFTFNEGGVEAVANNALKGAYKEKDASTIEGTPYILGKKNEVYSFFKMTKNNEKLAANKAYLVLSQNAAAPSSIIIGGQTTGIDEIVTEAETEVYFDLQGRRVQNPTKGIYVTKSGKKVIFN